MTYPWDNLVYLYLILDGSTRKKGKADCKWKHVCIVRIFVYNLKETYPPLLYIPISQAVPDFVAKIFEMSSIRNSLFENTESSDF